MNAGCETEAQLCVGLFRRNSGVIASVDGHRGDTSCEQKVSIVDIRDNRECGYPHAAERSSRVGQNYAGDVLCLNGFELTSRSDVSMSFQWPTSFSTLEKVRSVRQFDVPMLNKHEQTINVSDHLALMKNEGFNVRCCGLASVNDPEIVTRIPRNFDSQQQRPIAKRFQLRRIGPRKEAHSPNCGGIAQSVRAVNS